MRFARYCILFSLVFLSVSLTAKNVNTEIDSLWHTYPLAKTSPGRVNILVTLGDKYLLLDKQSKRDSIFDIAVQAALLNDSLLFNIYDKYFYDDIHYISPAKAKEYSSEMLSIAHNTNKNEYLYRAYAALAKTYLITGDKELANDNINKAYYHVSQVNDDLLKGECMLLLGYCKEQSNKKIEAFRNYMDALYLAEKIANDSLKIDCFQKLSDFYTALKKYDRALIYKKKQFKLELNKPVVDSNELMNLNLNFADILYHNHEIPQAEKVVQDIITYAKANGCEQVKVQAFYLYRTYLVDNGLFSELRDLYEKQYPDEYQKIAKEDTTLYYRLNGYIYEANGKPDSAELFYKFAEVQMAGRSGSIPRANFYKRYGEFLLRRNNINGAIQKLDSAYKYASKANYFPYLIDVTHYLDSLNYVQRNVDQAYQFSLLNKHYSDLQASVNKGEEMLQLEVENEAKQQELRTEMDKQEIERRHNIQYTFMVIAIIGIFILLLILGSFKVHPGMIRALGFFSFIFFFEFITMLADHRIHDFTNGEPWKFMAFKIVLIAGLLPLHHWLEEKVIHYLMHHKLIDTSRFSFKRMLFKKPQSAAIVIEDKPSDN